MPSSYEGYNITGIVGRINSDPLSAVKLKKNNKLEFFEKLPQSVVKRHVKKVVAYLYYWDTIEINV